MAGPLENIRVLDLGRFIPAPFSALLLADLGAEVIRIERAGGGQDRYLGFVTPAGYSYSFVNQNRNKKAISLNFEKNEKAREILKDLVKNSDVVLENFSPEAAKAFGITYEDLQKVNPAIIFAHVSAFGPSGPYSHRIGFDQIIKGMSGAMSVSGFPDRPTKEQTPHIDYFTGALTALGIVSAVYHREKTGIGQMVDTSLLQSAITFMAPALSEWGTGGELRKQTGNRSPWVGPADLYKTKDGRWVMVCLLTNSIWRRFCRHIGREDILNDPRFHNDLARWYHRDIVDKVVSDWVASKTAEEVVADGEKVPIPCGICYRQDEVTRDPQVIDRKMLVEVPEGDGTVLVTGVPIGMSETPPSIERSVPKEGEHNEDIYCGVLGYSREDLARLEEEGVL